EPGGFRRAVDQGAAILDILPKVGASSVPAPFSHPILSPSGGSSVQVRIPEEANGSQASHRSTFFFQTPFARSQLQTSQSRLGSADNIFDDTLPPARISSTAKSQLQSVCRTGQSPPALPLMLPRSFALRRSAQRWRPDNSVQYRLTGRRIAWD